MLQLLNCSIFAFQWVSRQVKGKMFVAELKMYSHLCACMKWACFSCGHDQTDKLIAIDGHRKYVWLSNEARDAEVFLCNLNSFDECVSD